MNEREIPNSYDAEQSVLGAMLMERRAVLAAMDQLTASDFHREPHRKIFTSIVELSQRGTPADFVSVAEDLRCRGQLVEVGNSAYLAWLIEVCPSAGNIDTYVAPIVTTSIQRRIIALGERIVTAAFEPSSSAQPLIEFLEREVLAIAQRGKGSTLKGMGDALLPVFEQILRNYQDKGTVSGLSSPWPDLDRKTTGFHDGNLIVVGARTGMGKSSMGIQIAEHVAKESQKPVLFFSLEMSLDEIIQRMLAQRAQIDISSLRRGFVEEHFRDLGESFIKLKGLPLFIDETPSLTSFEIRARAHRMAAEKGLSMVVVDYLQLVKPSGERMARHEQVGQVARDFKALARELNVPVIALAQINRGVEERENKRPLKSDLRESGDIEQTADLILLLYRDSYYVRRGQELEVEEAEIIIDKNRQGPGNVTVVVGWRGKYAQFVEHMPDEDSGYRNYG